MRHFGKQNSKFFSVDEPCENVFLGPAEALDVPGKIIKITPQSLRTLHRLHHRHNILKPCNDALVSSANKLQHTLLQNQNCMTNKQT